MVIPPLALAQLRVCINVIIDGISAAANQPSNVIVWTAFGLVTEDLIAQDTAPWMRSRGLWQRDVWVSLNQVNFRCEKLRPRLMPIFEQTVLCEVCKKSAIIFAGKKNVTCLDEPSIGNYELDVLHPHRNWRLQAVHNFNVKYLATRWIQLLRLLPKQMNGYPSKGGCQGVLDFSNFAQWWQMFQFNGDGDGRCWASWTPLTREGCHSHWCYKHFHWPKG